MWSENIEFSLLVIRTTSHPSLPGSLVQDLHFRYMKWLGMKWNDLGVGDLGHHYNIQFMVPEPGLPEPETSMVTANNTHWVESMISK